MVGTVKDLTGKKFGMLTVLKLDHIANKRSFWLCKCDCGNIKVIRGDCLKSSTGRPVTVSCGCYNRNKKSAYIDNRSKDKLYHVYYGILQRCNNPDCTAYKHYGGRGIKCLFENWESFRDWSLSHGHKEGLTIDRINVNGNYEPKNCRWITIQEQQLNKNRACDECVVEYEGKLYNLTQLAKIVNIKYGTLYYRYKHNLPLFTQSVTTMPKGSTQSIDTAVEVGETSK